MLHGLLIGVLGRERKGVNLSMLTWNSELQQPKGEDQSNGESCHCSQRSCRAAEDFDTLTQCPFSQGLAALTSLRHAKLARIYSQTKSVLAWTESSSRVSVLLLRQGITKISPIQKS